MENTTSVSSATEPNETEATPDDLSDPRSVSELLGRMQAQHERMSVSNPTKRLLWLAAQTIVRQGLRLKELEMAEQARASRIVLPG